jgi:DNA-binding transcriptional LysR family regulator
LEAQIGHKLYVINSGYIWLTHAGRMTIDAVSFLSGSKPPPWDELRIPPGPVEGPHFRALYQHFLKETEPDKVHNVETAAVTDTRAVPAQPSVREASEIEEAQIAIRASAGAKAAPLDNGRFLQSYPAATNNVHEGLVPSAKGYAPAGDAAAFRSYSTPGSGEPNAGSRLRPVAPIDRASTGPGRHMPTIMEEIKGRSERTGVPHAQKPISASDNVIVFRSHRDSIDRSDGPVPSQPATAAGPEHPAARSTSDADAPPSADQQAQAVTVNVAFAAPVIPSKPSFALSFGYQARVTAAQPITQPPTAGDKPRQSGPISAGPPLRVYAHPSTFGQFREALEKFDKAHPNIGVKLVLDEDILFRPEALFDDDRADIIYYYATGRREDFYSRHVSRSALSVHVGSRHPLTRLASVNADDLLQAQPILLSYRNALQPILENTLLRSGVDLSSPALTTDNIFRIMKAVRGGEGYFAAYGTLSKDFSAMDGMAKLNCTGFLEETEIRQAVSNAGIHDRRIMALANYLMSSDADHQ